MKLLTLFIVLLKIESFNSYFSILQRSINIGCICTEAQNRDNKIWFDSNVFSATNSNHKDHERNQSSKDSSASKQQNNPKLNFEEDYYSILEVDNSIDQEELKRAYYKIVFKYHPDNKPTKQEKDLCNQQMMVINAAYKVLRNPELRKAYDAKRLKKQVHTSNPPPQQKMGGGFSKNDPDPISEQWIDSQSAVEDKVESLASILTEIWNDIQKDNGKSLMEEFLQFLEQADNPNEAERNEEKLKVELKGIEQSIDKLQNHRNDLINMLLIEESLLKTYQATSEAMRSTKRSQIELEKLERMTELRRRLATIESQMASWQLKKDQKILQISQFGTPSDGEVTYRSSPTDNDLNESARQSKIDQELRALKHKRAR